MARSVHKRKREGGGVEREREFEREQKTLVNTRLCLFYFI